MKYRRFLLNGKPNVTKVRINFLERAHPVFACEFYWHIGKQHNFERGKNYVKCTYRLDGRAGQVNFWLEGHPSAYYPVRPDQTQSMNILPLSVRDFEIFVST